MNIPNETSLLKTIKAMNCHNHTSIYIEVLKLLLLKYIYMYIVNSSLGSFDAANCYDRFVQIFSMTEQAYYIPLPLILVC